MKAPGQRQQPSSRPVQEFEQTAAAARRSGDPAAYSAALSLYRGELLPENRYDDWAAERRDDLARLHGELQRELAATGPRRLPGLPAEVSSFVGRGRELADLLGPASPDAAPDADRPGRGREDAAGG